MADSVGIVKFHPKQEPKLHITKTDIVFVHGLGGHFSKTWQAKDWTVWPRDLLPILKDIHNVRVLSFDYNSSIKGSTAMTSNRAKQLLVFLEHERQDLHARARPVVFVGHSLGGVIIKQAIRLASPGLLGGSEHPSLGLATLGVMFFATPHGKIDEEVWKKFCCEVLRLNKPNEHATPTTGMLKQVIKNTAELAEITEEFCYLEKQLGLVSFIEEDEIREVKSLLVRQDTSLLAPGQRLAKRLPGDHLQMCKFNWKDKDAFEQSVGKWMKWIIDKSPRSGAHRHRQALNSLCQDIFHQYFLSKEATPGTCGWITKRLEDWIKPSKPKKPRQWIHGPPGCGKSYAAKHLITSLHMHGPKFQVVHCFLKDSSSARNNVRALLRATVHLALTLKPDLIEELVVPVFQDEQKLEAWSMDELRALWPKVMARLAQQGPLFVIVDGFDEIGKECRDEFLKCIRELEHIIGATGDMRLLLLSREYEGIDIQSIKFGFDRHGVSHADTKTDIEKSIMAGLETIRQARAVRNMPKYSEAVRTRLKGKILEHAKGSYLWAAMAVERLSRTLPEASRLEDIYTNLLPKRLAGLCDEILEAAQKNPEAAPFIRHVLLWLTFQRRGLNAAELNIAQALGCARDKYLGHEEMNNQKLGKHLVDDLETEVDWWCGEFVKRTDNGHFEIIHREVKEYLTTRADQLLSIVGDGTTNHHHHHHRSEHYTKPRVHAALGSLCATYLAMPYFRDSGVPGIQDETEVNRGDIWETKVRKRILENSFVSYAALNWSEHLREAGHKCLLEVSTDLDLRHLVLLEDKATHYAISWTEVWWFYQTWPRMRYSTDAIGPMVVHKGSESTADEQTTNSGHHLRAEKPAVTMTLKTQPTDAIIKTPSKPEKRPTKAFKQPTSQAQSATQASDTTIASTTIASTTIASTTIASTTNARTTIASTTIAGTTIASSTNSATRNTQPHTPNQNDIGTARGTRSY
ncbi:hypothetical protein B0H63DRAFT_555240 [Podospora didyma]|uniref:DUF676 domain-containing protein n=1 Tax=Podospora didyma TaxID=330526 RepID=A0AAE0U7Z6_9PEZI|nr:hypothetical protein B0H63DRAFT_555240 [Podospora didyma]